MAYSQNNSESVANSGLKQQIVKAVSDCWRYDLSRYLPVITDDCVIGYITHKDSKSIALDGVFVGDDGGGIRFANEINDPESRSHILDAAVRKLVALGRISGLSGELYPVCSCADGPVLAWLDRNAAIVFGIQTYGVHLNGYVTRNSEPWMWVATRASHKRCFPSMLDNIVAGGQPLRLSEDENLAKESLEEAGIDKGILSGVRRVGRLAYRLDTFEGLVDSVISIYDIMLPENFVPTNLDGEVESFELLPCLEVAKSIAQGRFKFNAALVAVDFLVRHNQLITSADTEYPTIMEYLRRADPKSDELK